MGFASLLGAGLLSSLTAAVYTWVGLRVGRPGLDPQEQRAIRMFKLWWHALAGVTYVASGFLLLAAFGALDVILFEVLYYLELLALCLALWGLGYYLAFLFTGRQGWLWPLGLFYAGFLVVLLYIVVRSDPVGVIIERWQVRVEFAHPDLLGEGATTILLALFLGPQIIGAFAYLTLFFKTDDAWARYRIAMVSVSLLIWFGSGIAASLSGIGQAEVWALASRFISLVAALAILAAYRPPAGIRRRLDRTRQTTPP